MLNPVQPAGDTVKAVMELQGFKVSVVSGAAADTKIDIADIRQSDTVLSAVNFNSGVPSDVTADVSIVDVRASGTLTVDAAVADGDTAAVDGVTYTFKATPGVAYTDVQLGADENESAANLAAAINGNEGGPGAQNRFFATANGAVVTITYRDEGTAGNAIALAGSANVTASGASLTGGTNTGGIKVASVTNDLLVYWYKKTA